MTSYGRRDHKTTKWLLPARGMQDVRLHLTFSILVTNFSKKSILLHIHKIIGVVTERSTAVLTTRKDNIDRAHEDAKADCAAER